MADVITGSEVDLLEKMIAPWRAEEYCGPPLGSRHVYPQARVPRVSGHEPPDWLIEQRRLERLAAWVERDRVHALAMALDQAVRERQRYRVAAEGVSPLPRRRPRRKPFAILMRCDCGHSGQALIPVDRPLPKRLVCSQCDEVQEL